jgi:hypothetical protein
LEPVASTPLRGSEAMGFRELLYFRVLGCLGKQGVRLTPEQKREVYTVFERQSRSPQSRWLRQVGKLMLRGAVPSSVHVELILIHPFREGNERIARLLCDVMAVQADVRPLDYKGWDHRADDYFATIRAGVGRDLEPMKQLFRRALPGGDQP